MRPVSSGTKVLTSSKVPLSSFVVFGPRHGSEATLSFNLLSPIGLVVHPSTPLIYL